MNNEIVQFLVDVPDDKSRTLYEVDRFPACFGRDVPGVSADMFRLGREGGHFCIEGVSGVVLSVNGEDVNGKIALKSGDVVVCNGLKLRFFVKHLNTHLSFGSLFLARLAISVIVVFMVMEVLLMLGLPRMMMAKESIWEKAKSREDLTMHVENLRYRLNHIELKTPFMEAVAMEFSRELEKKVAYIRANEMTMHSGTRRAMEEEVKRMNDFLTRLGKDASFAEPPQPDVESAVKAVIEKAK